MSQPSKDKELKSDTEVQAKEETHSESNTDDAAKTSSTTSSSPSEEEGKKCMDPMDYVTRKAKEIVIDMDKKLETGAGKSTAKAHAGKRRKRAQGRIKESISLRSGLNELGMTYDSDSEQVPQSSDVVAITKQKDKAKEEEDTDVFQGSETDSEEACKRTKKERNTDDDSDDSDGAEGGRGGVAHKNLSGGLGFEIVAGK